MLVAALETLPLKSKTLGMAGEEYAVVEAPPSKAVNSSKSRSESRYEPRCPV